MPPPIFKDFRTWLGLVFAVLGVVLGYVFTREFLPWLVIATVVFLLIAFVRWRAEQREIRQAGTLEELQQRTAREKELRDHFVLCKPVDELHVQDFGFEPRVAGEAPSPNARPFYPGYVPRRIVRGDSLPSTDSEETLSERDLIEALLAGRGFVLHGAPTMGKSRTVYEIVTSLHGWMAIMPRKDAPTPPTEAFETLLADRDVVLIIEDLSEFAGSPLDWAAFIGPKGLGQSRRYAVAATCRTGPEANQVKATVMSPLHRFYEDVPLKLTLLPQSAEEKGRVATAAGKTDWDPERASEYATPGDIVMEEALRYQHSRFRRLSKPLQDALRSLQLLAAAGVFPLTTERLVAVSRTVFHREMPNVSDVIDELAATDFVRPLSGDNRIRAERAYLTDRVVSYTTGKIPANDFPALRDALYEAKDAEGLFYLGLTLQGPDLEGDCEGAVQALDRSLELDPNNPDALLFRGRAQMHLRERRGALSSLEKATEIEPSDTHLLMHQAEYYLMNQRPEEAMPIIEYLLQDRKQRFEEAKAVADQFLHALNMSAEEAVAMLDHLLQDTNQDPEEAELNIEQLSLDIGSLAIEEWRLLVDKGWAQFLMEDYDAALKTLDDALTQNPGYEFAIDLKAQAHLFRGDPKSALIEYSALPATESSKPHWQLKIAIALAGTGDIARAVDLLDTVIEQKSDGYAADHATLLKAEVLHNQGSADLRQEALKAVIALEPGNEPLLAEKGRVLELFGKYDESLVIWDRLLESYPEEVLYLGSKASALMEVTRYSDALKPIDQILALDPNNHGAILQKARTLIRMGDSEAAYAMLPNIRALECSRPTELIYKAEVLDEFPDYGSSLPIWERLLEFSPNDTHLLFHRVRALVNLGRKDEALAVLVEHPEVHQYAINRSRKHP